MSRAVYPGSFDPVTLGHFDLIERSSLMMDHVIVGVLVNQNKSPLFTIEERVKMLESITSHLPNVEVKAFEGLLVDFLKENNAKIIIRGLRAITDFDYELQMAQTNRVIAPDIDTIFLTTNLKYSYLSASTVKEIAKLKGDISQFLHTDIAHSVRKKIEELEQSN